MTNFLIEPLGGPHKMIGPSSAPVWNTGNTPSIPQNGGLPFTPIADLVQMKSYYDANVGAFKPVPYNSWADFNNSYLKILGSPTIGIIPEYSTVCPWSQDMKRLMFVTPNGLGLWDAQTFAHLGLVPFNEGTAGNDKQEWRWVNNAPTPCAKHGFSGGEGDIAVRLGSYYWAAKDGLGNVRLLKPLTGTFEGAPIADNPQGLTMTPDGQWLLIKAEEAVQAISTRFYRTTDLLSGDASKPIYVPTSVVNGVRSIGHSGMAIDADGSPVFVSRDSRDGGTDDIFKFNPATGIYTKIGDMKDLTDGRYDYAEYWANSYSPGWALLTIGGTHVSTGWYHEQTLLWELNGNRVIRLGHTQNKYFSGQYFSQPNVCMSKDGRYVIWASNWNGTTNMRPMLMDLGAEWWKTIDPVPPVPTKPTVTISISGLKPSDYEVVKI